MELERLTKALSDQTRLRIVLLLTNQGELCVCDLTDVLDMAQPKISRHLAILRDSGLLQTRKDGQWVYYSIHLDLPEWAKAILDSLQVGSENESIYTNDKKSLTDASNQLRTSCV